MARTICIGLPDPQPGLALTVPGVGEISVIRQFSNDAFSICADASAFINGLQPIFAALGLPLCILGCITAVIGVFSTSFPYVDPSALPNIATQCACLATFTPFGFCSMLSGITAGLLSLMTCITGLLADIVLLEAQAGNMALSPSTASAGACLSSNCAKLLDNVQESFNPVSKLFDAIGFLFAFVGVGVGSLGELTGDTVDEVLDSAAAITATLNTVNSAINSVCP